MIKETLDTVSQAAKANLNLTQNDFDHMVKHYKEFKEKGKSANWIDTPWGLTHSTKSLHKLLRHYVVATLLDWTEVASLHQKKLKDDYGIAKDDIEAYTDYLSGTINTWKKYYEDAIAALNESVEPGNLINLKEDTVEEDIEKHDVLNPKLYNKDNLLKDEVREKILQIITVFTEGLEEDGISIFIKDIVIIGSNANYNYTKDSDIDIHVITDLSSVECPAEVYDALYSAYRSLFNKKFDIEFYKIPVEIFIETEGLPTVSNGIYSVKENEWIKEPVQSKIPDIDMAVFAEKVSTWQERGDALILQAKDETQDPNKVYDAIKKYIEDIYEMRKAGLKDGDEYSIDNLTFKEIRNIGMFNDLKALKDKMASKILSLISLNEKLDEKIRAKARTKITQIAHIPPIIQDNGHFYINNVPDDEVDNLVKALKKLDCVETASRGAPGKYVFPKFNFGALPTRLFTIAGKLKE